MDADVRAAKECELGSISSNYLGNVCCQLFATTTASTRTIGNPKEAHETPNNFE